MAPYLHFLQSVASRLPEGAAVLVVLPADRPREFWLSDYLIALSQLPDSAVVVIPAASIAAGKIPATAYVACFHGEIRQGPYTPVFRTDGGSLYRRIR